MRIGWANSALKTCAYCGHQDEDLAEVCVGCGTRFGAELEVSPLPSLCPKALLPYRRSFRYAFVFQVLANLLANFPYTTRLTFWFYGVSILFWLVAVGVAFSRPTPTKAELRLIQFGPLLLLLLLVVIPGMFPWADPYRWF